MLTGVAALITAVVTLAALFTGGDDGGSTASSDAEAAPLTVPGQIGDGCLTEYFKGIPESRLGTVEAGAYDDVLEAHEPKAGPLGLTFTEFGKLIGAIRFAFFPENTFFKVESFVDASCNPVEDYENELGGDKHNWRDSSNVVVKLGDRYYAVNASGGGNIVRVMFTQVAR